MNSSNIARSQIQRIFIQTPQGPQQFTVSNKAFKTSVIIIQCKELDKLKKDIEFSSVLSPKIGVLEPEIFIATNQAFSDEECMT